MTASMMVVVQLISKLPSLALFPINPPPEVGVLVGALVGPFEGASVGALIMEGQVTPPCEVIVGQGIKVPW